MELLIAQRVKPKLGPWEKPKSNVDWMEAFKFKMDGLTLMPPKPARPAKKARFALRPKLKAVVQRIVRGVRVACGSPLFPERKQVCGARRCLDEFSDNPIQPPRKRPALESLDSSHLQGLDLKDFEIAQQIYWDKYHNVYKKEFNWGSRRWVSSYPPQIVGTTVTQVHQPVRFLPSKLQILAYKRLLDDADMLTIPQYRTLLISKLENARTKVEEKKKIHSTERREFTKAQHALRCSNSLIQKLANKAPNVSTAEAENRDLKFRKEKVGKSFRRILKSRCTERGWADLVEHCNKRYQSL